MTGLAIAQSAPAIDKGVPIPPANHGAAGRKRGAYLPFRQMQIGDSFVFPGAADRAGAAISAATRRMQATFAMRTIEESGKRVVRVWRVA